MDPLSLLTAGFTIGGMALNLFGGSERASIANEEAQIDQQIEQQNVYINQQRQQQMVLDSNRQQLQDIRNSQRARSMAQSAAVNQGANLGTALPGSYGQISGQTQTNLLGISQNKQIANNVFGAYSQIDQYKEQLASLQGQSSNYQFMSSLGSALSSSAGPLGRLGTNLFGVFGPSPMSNGGMGISLTTPSTLY